MSGLNLAASRFILERFFDELESYDRDITVASGLSVGEVADALLAFLCHREIARLSLPKPKLKRPPSSRRRPKPAAHGAGRPHRAAALPARS